jgi:hypothetical protein
MRTLAAPFLFLIAAACSDATGPAGPDLPETPAPAEAPVSSAAADPIADALDRIVPALGNTPAAASLRADLVAIRGGAASAAQAADIERTLRLIEQDDPAAAAEVDVIRLAIAHER